jgi:hypothetical protein
MRLKLINQYQTVWGCSITFLAMSITFGFIPGAGCRNVGSINAGLLNSMRLFVNICYSFTVQKYVLMLKTKLSTHLVQYCPTKIFHNDLKKPAGIWQHPIVLSTVWLQQQGSHEGSASALYSCRSSQVGHSTTKHIGQLQGMRAFFVFSVDNFGNYLLFSQLASSYLSLNCT